MKIFMSYGHDENEPLVQELMSDITRRGHSVWIDKREIKAGHDWRRAITDGISSTERFLSILSKHSTRSPGVCLDEIAIAIGVRGGNIQTILVEDEREVRPPASISHVQWLDMQEWKQWKRRGGSLWKDWYDRKLNELLNVLESDESQRFSGEIEALSMYLQPCLPDSRVHDLISRGFVGREWLQKQVNEWRLNDFETQLLLITGPPGVGKSSFLAQLSHFNKDMVIAAQFCQHDRLEHRDASMIVRSLAFQIGTRLPDYRKILLKLLQIHRIEKMSPGHLFTFLIAEPLRNAIDGNRDRYLIVIDALDEAGESGNNELVRTLAENLAQLPRWIGILVTSRPESRIVSKFQSMKMVSVDAGANLNLDDIRDYLRLELQNELSGSSAPEEIIESIVEKSEGVFMYAECFCREVHRGLQSLNGPVGFPQGLSALYSRDFERQFTDADDFGKELLPALRAILAAREPLPLHLLQKAIDCSDEDLATLIRKLGTFFPVSVESGKRVIKVFHKSLGDWLTDADFAGDYFVSRREGHKLFIELLWPYRLQHPDISQCHGYPAKHLAGHLIAAGDWSRFEQLLHDSLEVWLNYWVEGGGGTDGRACISSFLTAVDDGEIVTSATLKLVLSNQMARLLAQVGYYPEAMTMIRERVLPHCSVWHRRKQRAIAEHEIGSLYFYDNDESGAVSSYRRALLIALFGLPVYWGEVAANAVGLASLCIPAGKFRTVQGWCLLAGVASWRSSDWPHRIAALRLRARAAMELGRYQIADKVLKRASEMSERQNVMHELVRVQLQRAWLCLDLFTLHETHLSTCRELFEQAEVLAESCGFTFEYWEARIGRCWAALAESETALASEFAAPLRALAETTHDVHLARRLITLGAIRHQQHAHEEACRLYRKGIQAAERQSCPVWKRMGMIAIGAIHWHSESQDQAKTIWSSVTSDAERFSVAHRQLCIQAINRCRRSAESVPTSA